MKWILIDVAIALLALALLAVLVLGLWRRVKALSREVARAGEAVGTATEALAAAQGDGPLDRSLAGPPAPATSRSGGVQPQDRSRSARGA